MVGCTNPQGIPLKEPGAIRPARDARIQFVACGKCMACRLNHARDWATRLMHEASQHEDNSFLTLTYSDEHLPDKQTLVPDDLRLFLMRLRTSLYPKRIRFFACGEYGGKTQRPHYHLILFGHAFREDRYPWQLIRDNLYYRSAALEALWPLGHALISDVTTKSAGYVARYSVKKANASTAAGHNPYLRINPETGEIWTVLPEFIRMSRRPGIGFNWIDRFASDAFPSGFLITDGKKTPIPRAYTRRLKEHHENYSDSIGHGIDAVEHQRHEHALKHVEDRTPERLATKEELLRLRTERLQRDDI